MPKLIAEGPVWTLDLGDDENRFSPTWMDSVIGALDEVSSSDEPAALMTIGRGKIYSNGLDLEWMGEHPDDFFSYLSRVHEVLARVLVLPVPTVAAINGHAFGAGAMLALAHDFRAMREDRGFFCLPEVDLGMTFTPGMNSLVTSKLTPAAATATMTTGRRYGGSDARSYGIVDACAGESELAERAAAMVGDLAGKNRETLGAIKSDMYAETLAALRGE